MQRINVTDSVWRRILAVKSGTSCLCCGDWSAEERDALELYGALARETKTPQFFAQIGQSLDGRIATVSGDAQDISGADGLAHLHRLRALADAVVIGVKTALHDSPQLTVRLARGDNPARIVIDPDGRLPNEAGLLQDTSARRIVIQACDMPRPEGVEVIRLSRDGMICPHEISDALCVLGFRKVLIEGGAITIAQFLEAGLLHRLHVAIAPLLIGAGPQGLTTSEVPSLAQALRPETRPYNLGSDVLFDCALADAQDLKMRCQRANETSVLQFRSQTGR
jgi:riboflavin-specific deaminase-like protein